MIWTGCLGPPLFPRLGRALEDDRSPTKGHGHEEIEANLSKEAESHQRNFGSCFGGDMKADQRKQRILKQSHSVEHGRAWQEKIRKGTATVNLQNEVLLEVFGS